MHAPTRLRSRVAAGLVAGIAAATMLAAPATAKPLENAFFTESETIVDRNFCGTGTTVTIDVTREVHALGVVRKPGTAPHFQVNFAVEATYTDADGDQVYESVRGIEKDLKITDNGDGTITILVLSTGNAAVYDESGRAIARNPGQVRFEILIDTNDTIGDPTDDQFIEFLGLVKGSTGRTDDFCGPVLEALG
jgi:hypothetical protein